MSLAVGTRFGPYEILAPLGAGGMGEVYRARDTKLGRDVALKILPEAFASDRDRLMRFEREAKTLASLNHPHIAQIYGVEDRALVMELVEGEDLAAKIARGPLPVQEALDIAAQIAEALEAAHAENIIHRDLKPSNIKLRADGAVKVLDFGLAKGIGGGAGGPGRSGGTREDLTNSPTVMGSARLRPGFGEAGTEPGIILGTAPYMSPEQARGQPIDRRSDLWAFGCVLYEMLTGRRAFQGDTASDVIAQVIKAEPEWSALPADVPDATRRLMQRCLEKNPQRRLRDAGDARLDLEERRSDAERVGTGRRMSWMTTAAIALVVAIAAAAIGLIVGRRLPEPIAAPITRATIVLPPGQRFESGTRAVAISPDGRQIVFSTHDGLYLRPLDSFDSRLIPGTAGAINPAFSPDGRRIAIWTLQGVKSIDPVSGSATALRAPVVNLGGILGSLSWDEHGLMLTQGAGGVFLFPPDGTDARRIIELAPGEAVSTAQMLPGGEYVLMTLLSQTPQARPGAATAQVVVQALRSGARTLLNSNGSDGRYLPTGHIVYASNGALYAIKVNPKTFATAGDASAVVEGVRAANIVNATMHYAVSDSGTLAYVPGQPTAAALALDLINVNRNGDIRHLHLASAPYEAPRISPDGRQVAMSTDDGTDASIWIHDLSQPGSLRKLTVLGRNRYPVWSPDGKRIAFQSNREGDVAIFSQAADGSDAPVRLTTAAAGTTQIPESWSSSGNDLLFNVTKDGTNSLWRLSLRDKRVEPYGGVSSSSPTSAVFSPNGKWVAYATAMPSGVHATFVQPFPATGAVYQISTNSDGHHPIWSRDGSELFYIPAPGRISVVKVTAGASFTVSTPSNVPPAGLMGPGQFVRNHDLLRDGSGFIGRQIAEDEESRLGAPPRVQIVTNWFDALNRRR